MHREVIEWVSRWATSDPVVVLDIGGRDLNGSTKPLFPGADYTVLDIRPGAGVGIVADAATWTPDREYDLVLCTEVFEHTPDWPQICVTAHKALRAGGRFVVTCAGPRRAPHSGIEATPLLPGEYYQNLDVAGLRGGLEGAGFAEVYVEQVARDLHGFATK
jgi:hypothetical protein